jgi:hypothetical protein
MDEEIDEAFGRYHDQLASSINTSCGLAARPRSGSRGQSMTLRLVI